MPFFSLEPHNGFTVAHNVSQLGSRLPPPPLSSSASIGIPPLHRRFRVHPRLGGAIALVGHGAPSPFSVPYCATGGSRPASALSLPLRPCYCCGEAKFWVWLLGDDARSCSRHSTRPCYPSRRPWPCYSSRRPRPPHGAASPSS